MLPFVVFQLCFKETNFKDKALQKIHSGYTLYGEDKLLQQFPLIRSIHHTFSDNLDVLKYL